MITGPTILPSGTAGAPLRAGHGSAHELKHAAFACVATRRAYFASAKGSTTAADAEAAKAESPEAAGRAARRLREFEARAAALPALLVREVAARGGEVCQGRFEYVCLVNLLGHRYQLGFQNVS